MTHAIKELLLLTTIEDPSPGDDFGTVGPESSSDVSGAVVAVVVVVLVVIIAIIGVILIAVVFILIRKRKFNGKKFADSDTVIIASNSILMLLLTRVKGSL